MCPANGHVWSLINGFTKVRYRGWKKNHDWLLAGFALADIYQSRKRFAEISQRLAPQAE